MSKKGGKRVMPCLLSPQPSDRFKTRLSSAKVRSFYMFVLRLRSGASRDLTRSAFHNKSGMPLKNISSEIEARGQVEHEYTA